MMCCGGRARPALPQRLPDLNAASALEQARKQFKETADPSLVVRRIDICKSCPFFQKEICNKCGCYLVAKVGIQAESCPARKW